MHCTIRTATLAALLAAGGFAQNESPAPAGQQPAMPRVSINFAGGTFAEFLAALRARDNKINIVAAAECSDIPMPAMAMTDASVHAALLAAAEVAPADYDVHIALKGPGDGGLVFAVAVKAHHDPASARGAVARPRVAVFSLRRLTESWPTDSVQKTVAILPATILSAIAAGTGDAPMKKPMLRFHEDSGLLFAWGDPEQLDYVQQVLRNLEEGQEYVRKVALRESRPGAAGEKDAGKAPGKEAPKEGK